MTIQSAGPAWSPADRQALTYWLALAVGVRVDRCSSALIVRSRLGLALQAVRDSEVAARSLGVDVCRDEAHRSTSSPRSAARSPARSIYLQLLRIQPTAAFGVDWTAGMIFIVVIGGLGRIEGPILGTIVFFALQETPVRLRQPVPVILGVVAIADHPPRPARAVGSRITTYRPIALFGIQRRLVIDGRPGDPRRPPSTRGARPHGGPPLMAAAIAVRLARGRRRAAPRA